MRTKLSKNHVDVFITGLTRSGTTFLVALFHRMGFSTGYADIDVHKVQSREGAGGLEYSNEAWSRSDRRMLPHNEIYYPSVIKLPIDIYATRPLFTKPYIVDLKIKYIIVSVRDLDAVCDSFCNFSLISGVKKPRPSYSLVKDVFLHNLDIINKRNTPTLYIEFPKSVQNKEYLFDTLRPVPGVTREKLDLAFTVVADRDKVHY